MLEPDDSPAAPEPAPEPPAVPAPEPAPAAPAAARPAPRAIGRPKGSTKKRRNPPRRVDRPVITPRLGFFTKDDGTIDLDRTTDESLARIGKALTPEALKRLGLKVAESGEVTPVENTWKKDTPQLLDLANYLVCEGSMQLFGLTEEQASILVLRRKPGTHEEVSELSAELLQQYFPQGFTGPNATWLRLLVVVGAFGLDSYRQIAKLKAAEAAPASVSQFPAAVGATH